MQIDALAVVRAMGIDSLGSVPQARLENSAVGVNTGTTIEPAQDVRFDRAVGPFGLSVALLVAFLAVDQQNPESGENGDLHDMYAWLHYWAQLVVYEQNKR